MVIGWIIPSMLAAAGLCFAAEFYVGHIGSRRLPLICFLNAAFASFLSSLKGMTRPGLSIPENCSIITTGLPQNGQAVAAVVASPTISPPQDWQA